MGGVAEDEMSATPNSESIREQGAERPTPNAELRTAGSIPDFKGRTSKILWRTVDLKCVDPGLHAYNHRGKTSQTRHHLWLFRSRQPELELPCSPGNQSRNSRRAPCALAFESLGEAFVGCALSLRILNSPTEVVA